MESSGEEVKGRERVGKRGREIGMVGGREGGKEREGGREGEGERRKGS